MHDDPNQAQGNGLTRRQFAQFAAATTALGVIDPLNLAGAATQGARGDATRLKVGLIGCGGRGTGAAAQALAADSNTVLHAMGDMFPDRLESSRRRLVDQGKDRVDVPQERRFIGFEAYRQVIDSGVDVVLLACPPHFRPRHLEAALRANKHVFCEKPMAVDGPGVRRVLESAKLAAERKLNLVSGFCWRYSRADRATMQQIHDGAIGELRAVYTTYNTGTLGTHPRQPEWSDMEWQLRNWHHFNWISGDHIVEQACHSVDKIAWAFNGRLPVRCTAVGGRAAREGAERGNVYDHFSVTYEYDDGARAFHMCRQIANTPFDNSDYLMGSRGVCRINSWDKDNGHRITGETDWRYEGDREPVGQMYQTEHDELFRAIRRGEVINDGEWMAHSTLMAIMGRMAAYTGRTITWEQALASEKVLAPPAYEMGEIDVPSIAVPGRTPFM